MCLSACSCSFLVVCVFCVRPIVSVCLFVCVFDRSFVCLSACLFVVVCMFAHFF